MKIHRSMVELGNKRSLEYRVVVKTSGERSLPQRPRGFALFEPHQDSSTEGTTALRTGTTGWVFRQRLADCLDAAIQAVADGLCTAYNQRANTNLVKGLRNDEAIIE